MNSISTDSLLNELEVVRIDQLRFKITVLGVGGGGNNMIQQMIGQKAINSIDIILTDTDIFTLDHSIAAHKMLLGNSTTRSIGSGLGSERGRKSALESLENIKQLLEGSDIVFIPVGLGGGTGTGAAPVIAKAAKEVGALTVSIVTSPFKFEGSKRAKLARKGLEELKRESDSIIIFPNEKLLSIVKKNLDIKESFRIVDEYLAQAVGTISKVILSREDNDICLDFADVKTVMSHRGLALICTGYSRGKNAAYNATKIAMESTFPENISIDGAMGVLTQFDIHPDYPIMEIGEVMSSLEESAHEDASIIFSTTTYNNMDTDEAKITIIATGFES